MYTVLRSFPMARTQSTTRSASVCVASASIKTASLSPVTSDTELAGQVACWAASHDGNTLTMGLYGLTNTWSWILPDIRPPQCRRKGGFAAFSLRLPLTPRGSSYGEEFLEEAADLARSIDEVNLKD